MISSVFVSGRVAGTPYPGYRYVEVDRPLPDGDGKIRTDRFLVKDSLGSFSNLAKLPEGSLIVFKGRLEEDDAHGLVIVEEISESYRRGERAF